LCEAFVAEHFADLGGGVVGQPSSPGSAGSEPQALRPISERLGLAAGPKSEVFLQERFFGFAWMSCVTEVQNGEVFLKEHCGKLILALIVHHEILRGLSALWSTLYMLIPRLSALVSHFLA